MTRWHAWIRLLSIAALIALSVAGAAGSASAAPEVADPATEGSAGVDGNAVLAHRQQLETVSIGSTAGFAADPIVAGEPITPGATGWWYTEPQQGSNYTIDSCGSSFTAQLTAYGRVPRTSDYEVLDFTDDACADPLTGPYFSRAFDVSGPELIRIDDASGVGGEYVVNYSRTALRTKVEIRRVRVGKLKRIGGRKHRGRASVVARVDTVGEAPVKARCRLDGGKAVDCNVGATFKNVKSGKHTLAAKAVNSFGKATDEVTFTVPRRK
jgi:hypothetical protein